MQKHMLNLLKDLVACDSISCTDKENKALQFVYERLSELPYFQENPELMGRYYIPDDAYGRFIPYALIPGQNVKTVILSGHTDVVSTEVYGEAEPLAFTLGSDLEQLLSDMPLNDIQRRDMDSGEWIWGRGAADMKAGVVINFTLLEKYAALAMSSKPEGSLLFMALPDEESYSAGMRHACHIMKSLQNTYNLDYKLLICPEPAMESGDDQVMSLGSVGKTLPVIVTQGEVAHIGHCFNGISALNMLNGIFRRTNASLDFSDSYEGEATMPPMWQNMRDMKAFYDASIPYRGYGFFTVLSFYSTLDEIIQKLKIISETVFKDEVEKLDSTYQKFKTINKFADKEKIYYDTCVYTVEELCHELRCKNETSFQEFSDELYKKAEKKILAGDSFPGITAYMMDEILNYADIKKPLILIGAAPPYYPPAHSNKVSGKENFGGRVFEYAKKISEEEFNQGLTFENYFMGISDNSYTSAPKSDFSKLTSNYPMWGKLYSIDFDTISEVEVPSILYGPIGRDYHQWTERVNKRSFLEVMPEMLERLIRFSWDN